MQPLREPWHVTAVEPAITRGLRGRVLRPGQSDDELRVPHEDDPDAGWYAVVIGDVVVGCAGVLPDPRPDGPPHGWRVRAMATAPDHRSQGVGAALLARCARHVEDHEGSEIWCTARVTAAEFYLRRGFAAVGGPFEFHGLGPHLTMVGDPAVVSRSG